LVRHAVDPSATASTQRRCDHLLRAEFAGNADITIDGLLDERPWLIADSTTAAKKITRLFAF